MVIGLYILLFLLKLLLLRADNVLGLSDFRNNKKRILADQTDRII